MSGITQDLRCALRSLSGKPGFTLTILITLGLGIGASVTVFSAANALVWRPLPFLHPGQLVHLWQTNEHQGWNQDYASVPNFQDWKRSNSTFQDLGAFFSREYNLSSDSERVEGIQAARVSANLFPILAVRPQLGRTFSTAEEQPGRAAVALISDRLWQRRFGRARTALGGSITLQGQPHVVVGILPADFAFPLPTTDVWVPLGLAPEDHPRDDRLLQVVGRLAPGVSLARAQEDLDALAAHLAREYPDENAGRGVHVVPLREGLTFSFGLVRIISLTLALAAVFVMALVCANVGSLLLAHAAAKEREIAIRAALGGGHWPLLRRFLVETTLLGLLGGALGLIVAQWGVRLLASSVPENLYRVGEIALDRHALWFTLGLSLLTALVLGLIPGLQALRSKAVESLKEVGAGAGSGFRIRRGYNALVVSQIVMAMALLTGAVLMIQSFRKLQHVDPGFEEQNVLTMKLVLPESKYQDDEVPLFFQEALERLGSLPGVAQAAAVNFLPLNHETRWRELRIETGAAVSPDEHFSAIEVVVSPGYFKTMGIPIRKGRDFVAGDAEGAVPVAIVNEAMAQRLWPDRDCIDRRMQVVQSKAETPWLAVVGVVEDTRHAGLDAHDEPLYYVPLYQDPWRYARLLLKTDSDPIASMAAARQTLWDIDRDLPLTEVRTLEQVVGDSLTPQRATARMLMVLAVGALVLACVGVYGLMSYTVARRTQEIGVRLAIGAEQDAIFRLILVQALRLTGLGLGIGLVLATVLVVVMSSMLYGLATLAPLTFLATAGLLAAVAVLAGYYPARRASRLPPVAALHYE